MAAETDVQVLQELATDDSLLPLLEENFDPKSFATRTIQSQVVGEMLQKLTQGIGELDNELYTQVVTHYEDLLSQATGIEALESVLKMMQTRIDSLTAAVERISNKLLDPYQKIVARTDQLSRLQSACDLLRRIIRILYLMKRLKTQVQGGVKEITKVAQTFSEIDQLTSGQDLSDIEVLDEEYPWLQRVRKETESQAKKMLLQGLEHLNPSQIGVAVQVFYNLGQLDRMLVTVINSYLEAVQHEIQNAVDPSFILQSSASGGGSSGPIRTVVGTGSSTWKASLWVQLEKLSNSLWKLYRQSHQLRIVLAKKKDPVTQVSFLVFLKGTEAANKLNNFWDDITNNISIELNTAARASLLLNQTFESDYPKLIHAFSGLLSQVEKLHSETDEHSKSMASFLYPQSVGLGTQTSHHRQESLLRALSQFEKVYISRLYSRLSECINQLFSGNSFPKEDELTSFVRLLASELQASAHCDPLALILSNNVSKIISIFCAKCEQLSMTGHEAVQISAGPIPAQQRNIAIVNTLHGLQALSQEFILNSVTIAEMALTKIKSALERVAQLKISIMKPFVSEVTSALEKMVASMHREDFTAHAHVAQSDRRDSTDVPSSGFVREMLSFTPRICQDHLSLFNCQEELKEMLKGVAGRVLEVYVRHVCMVRPLTDGGKMRITSDMAQVELALIPLCSKLSEVGEPHKMLRSLRRILFLASDNFLSQPAGVGDIIPYSYVLNYLFSRAPPEIKSPHQLQNWTEEEYSEWMDKHPLEKDRLQFIKGTLDSYARKFKGQNTPATFRILEDMLKQAQQ